VQAVSDFLDSFVTFLIKEKSKRKEHLICFPTFLLLVQKKSSKRKRPAPEGIFPTHMLTRMYKQAATLFITLRYLPTLL
jgi:hypothetical protein